MANGILQRYASANGLDRILVPELTRSADIKLNERVRLQRHPRSLSLPHTGQLPPIVRARKAIIFRLAALFGEGQ
jgi:hypothetical protein